MISLNKVVVNPNDTKINLTKKGDYSEIKLEDFHVKIIWKTAIDMDLHAFYLKKPEGFEKILLLIKKYLFKIIPINLNKNNHIYYHKKGNKNVYPYIQLDHDAGVGNRAGNNEENMSFTNIKQHGYILVAVNIFNNPEARFSNYDCKAIITSNGKEFTIPLDSKSIGHWAVIAKIDNTGDTPKIINMSKISLIKPIIETFV